MATNFLSGVFGSSIFKRPDKFQDSLVLPKETEGSSILEVSDGFASMGVFTRGIDFEGSFKTEKDLILKYREVSLNPEASEAITNIVNEAIVVEEDRPSVEVVMDETDFSENIKNKISDEFNKILLLLNFNENGHELFEQWYIDGRLYFHCMKDDKNPSLGLKSIRPISPLQIKKIIEVKKENENIHGQSTEVIKDINEYYMFVNEELYKRGQAIKIHPDEICFVHSGIFDKEHKFILSHLHKAIKPVNQLRMVEDAVVIYRLVRAPERRLFYVDVGNMPKQKAEQTMKALISQYRNKVTYDAVSGEVVNGTQQMSMMEDFWLPRTGSGKGTEVDTLPGGQNVGEISDLEYFQKRMYKSLNVPVSRLDQDNAFGIGRSSEISRDEVKFAKFIARLRKRFSILFLELLEKQLILKNIVTENDWENNRYKVRFDYVMDNHFAELKNSEIMAERLNRLSDIDQFVGKYYSIDWVRKNVLMQTEEEIEELDSQMKKEESEGLYDNMMNSADNTDNVNIDTSSSDKTNFDSNPKAKDDNIIQKNAKNRLKKAE